MHPLTRRMSLALLIFAVLMIEPSADYLQATTSIQRESPPGLTVPRETTTPLQTTYARLPVYFESNLGQFDSQVQFVSRTRGVNVFSD